MVMVLSMVMLMVMMEMVIGYYMTMKIKNVRRGPNIAEVDMLMLTIEVAEFFPSRLLSAHIVVDPQSPAGVQLPRTRCQWLQQLLKPQIWILVPLLK